MMASRLGISLGLMTVLLALLALIAVLQYRWIGRVSEAEREHMEAADRAAAAELGRDFNAEISAHGGATKHVYIVRGDRNGKLALSEIDSISGEPRPIVWPPDLAKFRSGLESVQRGEGSPRVLLGELGPGFVVVPDRGPASGSSGRSPPGVSLAIMELDAGYIRDHLIPQLVQRHFGPLGVSNYDFMVATRGQRPEVIYRSDAGLSLESMRSPDVQAGLIIGPTSRRGGPLPVDQPGRWLFLVKYRHGSLEAAVEEARWRNLAISFGVFVLLVASIVMLLISTRSAQRLARLQMEFIAGVSHELRTPLAVISTAGANLADGVAVSRLQVKRYGTLIQGEVRRLTDMVEKLLGFGAAQSGNMRLELQPVEVRTVIDEALAACETEIQETACKVEDRVAGDLPPVHADTRALSLCVRNLVNNAIRHGGSGKWVGISAEAVTGSEGPEVRITVADHGSGIEPAELVRIFDPFFRGRRAHGAQTAGSGLGLSLVKRVMEAQHGSVEVNSIPGAGSCFTLRIPASTVHRKGAA